MSYWYDGWGYKATGTNKMFRSLGEAKSFSEQYDREQAERNQKSQQSSSSSSSRSVYGGASASKLGSSSSNRNSTVVPKSTRASISTPSKQPTIQRMQTPSGTVIIENGVMRYEESSAQASARNNLNNLREQYLARLGNTSAERSEQYATYKKSYRDQFDSGQTRLEQSLIGRGLGGSTIYGNSVAKYASEADNKSNLAVEGLKSNDENNKRANLTLIDNMLARVNSNDLSAITLGSNANLASLGINTDIDSTYANLNLENDKIALGENQLNLNTTKFQWDADNSMFKRA